MSDGEIRHWTRAGVFRLSPEIKLGVKVWDARFDDVLLGTYSGPYFAALDVAKGVFDDALPEPASSLGVPDDYKQWNMLK